MPPTERATIAQASGWPPREKAECARDPRVLAEVARGLVEWPPIDLAGTIDAGSGVPPAVMTSGDAQAPGNISR